MKRTCLDCGKPLIGRADKKFCDDSCRSNYNNRLNNANNNYVKEVNAILKKNRKILEQANIDGKTKIEREKLIKAGFNFQYFTNILETEKGNRYFFCYEHGYMELSRTYVLLVIRK
ncbi:hypothetical protein [Olivibacter sitiensis]|uniref:hypothetical protein n=1 Tax=Olivibacter sitiensis TaxID=376470 RepID=UPI0004138C2C|nr:hypothetical protein [Olivibacter sitiensis]